jgi:septal ring factor EnvC (AmiA/AmiB activator)
MKPPAVSSCRLLTLCDLTLCAAVLADEAMTALEAKDKELAQTNASLAQASACLAQANASLDAKSTDVDRLATELRNQTDCVSKLTAEVHCRHA